MTDKPTAGGGTPEPSMEDILASIRRILSEEGGEQAATAPPDEATTEAEDRGVPTAREDAAESTDDHGAARVGAILSTPDEAAEVEFVDTAPRGEHRAAAEVFDLTPAMRVMPVLSSSATSAATDVLSQLAKAILDRRDIAIGGRDVTLEGMVREMLRPLLREWLDRNLPYLIERLVKKEIDIMINRAERLDR